MIFFSKLRKYLDDNAKYVWPPIWVILGLVMGLCCISYQNSKLINIGSAFVWSLAYFVIGALAGMIFGVPNVSPESKVPTTIVPNNPQPIANINSPDIDINQQSNPGLHKKSLANTNLTQISDWLTKVIIGAGLVELREIPPFVVKVATKMAAGVAISLQPNILSQVSMMCAGILIYNTSFGFISGYLLMRIIFSSFI